MNKKLIPMKQIIHKVNQKCQMTDNDSDHYEVTIDEQETVDNLPNYPIDNLHFDVNEKDTLEGWIWEDRDSG